MRELLAALFEYGLVHQDDCWQVGGWPPTSLFEALVELLNPRPDRYVRALDADLAEHSLDLPETHAKIIQQDCQLHELAIRLLALEKLNLVQDLSQFGKGCVHYLQEEATLSIRFAKLTVLVKRPFQL